MVNNLAGQWRRVASEGIPGLSGMGGLQPWLAAGVVSLPSACLLCTLLLLAVKKSSIAVLKVSCLTFSGRFLCFCDLCERHFVCVDVSVFHWNCVTAYCRQVRPHMCSYVILHHTEAFVVHYSSPKLCVSIALHPRSLIFLYRCCVVFLGKGSIRIFKVASPRRTRKQQYQKSQ